MVSFKNKFSGIFLQFSICGMFLACLLLVSPCKAQGNNPNYYFDHYRLPEGYNAKSSRDVIQDKTGYVYITNENGLVRYNGHKFKYYREDKSNPKALQASYCVFMEQDPEDKIWLMAGPELQIFDPKTESFELRKQTMDTTAAYHPYSLRYDGKNKKMWVACADCLYYCNDGERKLIQVPSLGRLQPRPAQLDLRQHPDPGHGRQTLVKGCSWYDNEWGFSNRMLDTTLALIAAK